MKRVLVLCLALLCLTSCASLLERDYTVSAAHEEDPPPQGDSAYRVETYPALRSALLSYVEEGLDQGLLRFPTTYPGNLSVDLEKAKRQLTEEDPLGCYAVEDLTWRTSKIIAYYEVELTFTYKRDKALFRSLPKAATQGDLTALLTRALEAGEEGLRVYLTACPEDQSDYFQTALQAAWDSLQTPQDPAGETVPPSAGPAWSELPALAVELYPAVGGSRRVAELKLTQPQEPDPSGAQTEPSAQPQVDGNADQGHG